MDHSVFDEIKSRILRSASNPPPAAVVWAIVEAAGGGVPSQFSASRQVRSGVTTWRVVGLDKGLVFKIDASKPSDDWHGDTMRDDGKEDSVSLKLFEATTLVSARFESKRVESGPIEKRHETRVTGHWTFEFDSDEVAITSDLDDAASLVNQFLTILRDPRSAPPLEEA